MKRFAFRFEKILDYRRHIEKQKQRDLALAQELEQKQRDTIGSIVADRARQQADERGHLVGPVDARRLTGYSRYYLLLRQMERHSREVLRQIAAEVERRRLELIEAARKRKTYEKLKERHQDQHQSEYNLLLQKENDEIGQKLHWQRR